EGYFHRPSYRECTSRIERLSEADLATQVEMIRGSIYCKVATVHDESAATPSNEMRASTAVDLEELAAEARAIAKQLCDRAMLGQRGEMDWLGVSYYHKVAGFQVKLIGDNLFDGRCGVALFLAAHAAIAHDESSRRAALDALGPVRQRARSGFGSTISIGG